MKSAKQLKVLDMLFSDRYKVINDSIYRMSKGKWLVMKPSTLPTGYQQYTLSINKNSVVVYRHIAVYLADKHLPYPEGYAIDHIDRDKSNNSPENLRAVPHWINASNSIGRRPVKDLRVIRGKEKILHALGKSQSAIARELDLNRLSVRYTIKKLESGATMKYSQYNK
jgi:hypothetical protein